MKPSRTYIAPARGFAISVFALACVLPACRSTTTYLPKVPITLDAPPVTIRVKKAVVHRAYRKSDEFEIHVDATAQRTVQIGSLWLTPSSPRIYREDIEGNAFLFAGQTKRFVVNHRVIGDEWELPAIHVSVIEANETWQLRVPLVRCNGEPLLRPVERVLGAVTLEIQRMVQERNGVGGFVFSSGLGASRDIGPVRFRLSIDGVVAVCDPDTCARTDERPYSAWGGGPKAGIEMSPFVLADGEPGTQVRLGAELRYVAYRLNQPREGGHEGIWLHGPTVVPKLVFTELGVLQAGLEPGRGRGMDLGLPMGLLWTSGPDTHPSFTVGLSMMADF